MCVLTCCRREFEWEFFMHFNTFSLIRAHTCNYRWKLIDCMLREICLVISQVAASSRCSRSAFILDLFPSHQALHVAGLRVRMRGIFYLQRVRARERESRRLIKDHKMESVQQQQRLLMIPHGHSSTFVSFSCPRNSLIISSQLCVYKIPRERRQSALSQKTTLEAPFVF